MADLDRLLEELLSGDDDLAEEAALQLALHGEPARQRILPLLRSARADNRWWAVRSLGAFKDAWDSSPLVDSLEDPAAEVRQCAALVFRNHRSNAALPALIRSS